MWGVPGHLPGLVVQHKVVLVWPSQDTHPAVGHLSAWSFWPWHCQDLLCGVRLGVTSLGRTPGGLASHASAQLVPCAGYRGGCAKGAWWHGEAGAVGGSGQEVYPAGRSMWKSLCLYAGSCAWKTSCLLPPWLCSRGAKGEQLHLVLVLLQGSPRHERSVVSCHDQG